MPSDMVAAKEVVEAALIRGVKGEILGWFSGGVKSRLSNHETVRGALHKTRLQQLKKDKSSRKKREKN